MFENLNKTAVPQSIEEQVNGVADGKEDIIKDEICDVKMCPGSRDEPDAKHIEPQSLGIYVRDLSTTAIAIIPKFFYVEPSTTVKSFIDEVGTSFKYEPGTFSLVLFLSLKENADDLDLNSQPPTKLISEFGFCPERTSLILINLKSGPPKKMEDDDFLGLGASASPTSWASPSNWDDNDKDTATGTNDKVEYSYSPRSSSEIGYVGLVNQAMTCYLNSLLQTLFMTPEFRNALYRWEFKGSEEEARKNIPFQLQKLFLQLQTASRNAVETTNLTKSFGWDSSEAWQQHDIQELCRVMFDALEMCLKNTDQSDLISNLYEGKMKDYVKCLNCDNEGAREDTFLDIPLPIRPFGSSTAFKSVEEAIQAFIEPEILSGNNQYECSKCNKLCDAHKGLKFAQFPYLLTLHLKRFDFDYNTLHRIKLNDRVSFPSNLNLNGLCESPISSVVQKEPLSSPEKEKVRERQDDSSTADSGSSVLDGDDGIPELTKDANNVTQNAQDEDEGIDCSSLHNERDKSSGPYFYELFSIMIHSGSASGGHYYAYIKDFRTGEWFCFNDQNVTRITYDDIQKTYGGSSNGGYYSSYASSANAYMLMYRQINKARNAVAFLKEDLPPYITSLLSKMSTEEAAEKELREIERCLCKIKVFCQVPKQESISMKKLKVHKDTTFKETTLMVFNEFDLEGVVPIERCRLVKYEEVNDNIEASFDNPDSDPIHEVLGGVRSTYKFDLLLEILDEGREFEEYLPGGISVKVFIVNLMSEEVEGPHNVRASQLQTVQEFKMTIGKVLNLDSSKMRVVQERYYNELNLLDNLSKTLKDEGFYRSNKVYVEASGDESVDSFNNSQMSSILDRYENTMVLQCELPQIDDDILKELQIPAICKESSPNAKTLACKASFPEKVSGNLDIDTINNKKNMDICNIKKEIPPPDSPKEKLCNSMNALDVFDVDENVIVNNENNLCDKESPENLEREVSSEMLDPIAQKSDNEVLDKNILIETCMDSSKCNGEKDISIKVVKDELPEIMGKEIKITKKKKKEARIPITKEGEEVKIERTASIGKGDKIELDIKNENDISNKKETENKVNCEEVKDSGVNLAKKEKKEKVTVVVERKAEPEQEGREIPITLSTEPTSNKGVSKLKPSKVKPGVRPLTKVNKVSIASVFNQGSAPTVTPSKLRPASKVNVQTPTLDSSKKTLDNSSVSKAIKKINVPTEKSVCKIPNSNVENNINVSTSSCDILSASVSLADKDLLSLNKKDFNKDSRSPSPRLLPAYISYTIPKNITSTVTLAKSSGPVITTTTTICKTEPSTIPLQESVAMSASKSIAIIIPILSEPSPPSVSPHIPMTLPVSTTVVLDSPILTPPAQLSDEEEVPNEMEGAVASHVSSDQSASEDSSLTSDSDRTLVGDPPDDYLSARSNSPDCGNISSPEEGFGEPVIKVYNWDISNAEAENWGNEDDKEIKRYFRAKIGESPRMLEISVDKRITIGQLRKELEKYVGVSEEHFKLFKYNIVTAHEFEYIRMKESLISSTFGDNTMLKIHLGRALLPGEYKGKVYLLDAASCEEPAKFLIDLVISQGDSIKKVKSAIIKDVNSRCRMELEEDLVRLRKKSWKNPLAIYLDRQVFDVDITIYANWELYLQILTGPEIKTSNLDELSIFIKRWRPSSYTTEPLVEIIISKPTTEVLKQKLSEVSGILTENVEIAKGKGSFPCDMSVLDITTDLDWTQKDGDLDDKPLFIMDDGSVIYYRDKTELIKNLSDAERVDFETTENTRLNREPPYKPQVTTSASSQTKEKGLKIYLDPPSSK